jgi:hypothetical protein
MRETKALAVALLTSATFCVPVGGAAAADLCHEVEKRLERCEGAQKLSDETRAECAEAEQGFRAFCSATGIVYAAPSASGRVLDLLAEDYEIVDLDESIFEAGGASTPALSFAHVVIGPDALDRPVIMALIIRAYRAGLTVAIANATKAEADRFDIIVDGGAGASCLPADGEREIALYGLQLASRVQPPVVSRYCLPEMVELDAEASDDARHWLRERFAAVPPQADSAALGGVNLNDLAKSIHCSELVFDLQNNQIQQDVFLVSLRSFDGEADYYYVNNFVQYRPRVSNYRLNTILFRPATNVRDLNSLIGTRLLFTEPSTITEAVTQYTNSQSTTVSGGVGFGSSGFDVEASVSVTIGTATTVTVPPTIIQNTSNLVGAFPEWSFIPTTLVPNTLFDVATSFLWVIDRDIYPNGGEGATELFSFFDAAIQGVLDLQGQCYFPLPFPTWEVGPPEITRVEPPVVSRGGGSFLIIGEQMYPSIVDNVLLGGDALNSANFVPVDDTEVKVVVPGNQGLGLTPVQVNTFFNGQILPSNNDVEVDVRPR